MIEEVLEQRGGTHGDFSENAHVSQGLKCFIRENTSPVQNISHVQQEALDNICQKISRIITGDPNHVDSWVDIAGYATLVVRDLDELS